VSIDVTQHDSDNQNHREDRVDGVLREWRQRRPDLDFSPLEVVTRVLRAAHFLQGHLDAIAAAYGLSHTGDLDVLTNLDRGGPPYEKTPSELAELQLVTAGGMTVRLNRLQRAGLIERRPNPRDGRGVLVRLTPRGQQLADDALTTLIETQEADIGGLDAPQRRLLAGSLREMLLRLGDSPRFRPKVTIERE
jgi:DNA-binding MarR family transcriptional regulator